jgi:hypothetical protein
MVDHSTHRIIVHAMEFRLIELIPAIKETAEDIYDGPYVRWATS